MNGLVEALSDNRFGLFGRVTSERLAVPAPRWWISNAVLARAPVGTPFSTEHAACAGTSIEVGEATARAIGEGAERYSAMNAPTRLTTVPLSSVVFEPPRCDPSEAGAQWLSGREDPGHVTVAELTTVADGTPLMVPATMACLNFMPTAPERPVSLPISTGLAFAPTLTTAVWRAWCEVAERDALMRMWWCRVPLVRLTFDSSSSVPVALVLRLRELLRSGRTAHLFSLTDDFPAPGCFCVLESPSYPYLSCGAAVKDDLASACCKAIDEAVSLTAIAPHWQREGRHVPGAADEVTTLEDHAMFYAGGEHREAFGFLLDDPPTAQFDKVATRSWREPRSWDELSRLAVRFQQTEDWDVLWMDLTAPEVLPHGHVVKVVVPQLVPLSPDHNVAYLATPRLARDRPTGGFNPYPHPFA